MLNKPNYSKWFTTDVKRSLQNILIIGSGVLLLTLLIGYANEQVPVPILMGSFGASIFLVIAAPDTPFAKPKNVIVGHIIASATGLVSLHLLGDSVMSMAIAVSLATMLMLLLKVAHPPAASNPITIFLSLESWDFLWFTSVLGAIVIAIFASIFHRIFKKSSRF